VEADLTCIYCMKGVEGGGRSDCITMLIGEGAALTLAVS
jgi:hypothetical protein